MKKLILVALALLSSGITPAEAVTLKIATIAPETSDWMQGMRQGAKEIRERTDGRVVIKLYGGGVQGSDEQVFQKILFGQLQGGAFTPTVLANRYKDIILYNLPMVFKNHAEVDYVRERMDERLIQGLEDAGFITFGFASTGFSVILSNEPVSSIDDLEGKKVWAPKGDPVSKAALKALGLNVTQLPLSDVFTGLQTRLIEIVPGSPVGALVLQWHTKVDYMTDLPLLYTAGLTAISEKAFRKLSPGDQAIVTEVMTRLYNEYDEKSVIDDAKAKEALLNSGIERVVPDAEEAAEIRETVLTSNRRLAEQGEFSLDLYEEMLGYVDEYRQLQAQREDQAADSASTAAVGQE